MADGTLAEMQNIAGRIRNLSLQSMNGTYSDSERAMMQKEVENLTKELYRQKNSCKFNEIDVLGKEENAPTNFIDGKNDNIVKQQHRGTTGAVGTTGNVGVSENIGTQNIQQLTEDEAIAQGYTVIKTADELNAINGKGKYILMNDIDLTGVSWTAKNLTNNAEFDGNGYSISNLKGANGLFASNSGIIKNVNLTNATITPTSDKKGILVGSNSGTIDNCSVSGSLETSCSPWSNTGLFAGTNSGTITNSSATGTLIGYGSLGGFVGTTSASSIIKNSVSDCIVTAKEHRYNGGFAAQNNGLLENCQAKGVLNGNYTSGGLVANTGTTSKIINCTSNVTVNTTSWYAGGLVGENAGEIINSSSSGAVYGNTYIGGLVGDAKSTSIIKNCFSNSNVTGTTNVIGGLVGLNNGQILNSGSSGIVSGAGNIGGLVGNTSSTSIIKNSTSSATITATSTFSGGITGTNLGLIENSSSTVNINGVNQTGGICGENKGTIQNSVSNASINSKGANVGGFVATNSGNIASSISNAKTQNAITSGTVYTAGFVATNNASGTISNCQADGESNASYGNSGGFVGSNYGKITLSNATVNTQGSSVCGGFVASNNSGAIIEECFATGNSISSTNASGGFAGINNKGTINDCYSTGNAQGSTYLGGFAGRSYGDINNCYSTGNVVQNAGASTVYNGGFCGTSGSGTISNCYSSGTVNSNGGGGAFVRGATSTVNCYANADQADNITYNLSGVELKTSQWLNNSENLRFLGDAYDYYYTPPGLLNNPTDHPEEYSQFQIGSNSGEKNMIELNLVFRMNFYSANVSTVKNAEISIKNTDAFIDRISQKRSEIGATRNKLDSVMQSQAIKLENLSSSHSTIMDTDFASETARLARQQILQQASSSLLAQANMQPNIALQLLG